MGTFEQVFVKTGLRLEEVAARVAATFGMETARDEHGIYLSADNLLGVPGRTGIELTPNVYSSASDLYPDERTAFDASDAVLGVWRADKDMDRQEQVARALFDGIVERLGWPAVLLHNMAILRATWNPRTGLREYPPGATPDPEDAALWAEHAAAVGTDPDEGNG
jgi:hypothetical protein